MTTDQFIMDVQRFESVSAVGVSALRRQGKGTISKIQNFLAELDLAALSTVEDQASFGAWLDSQTEELTRLHHTTPIKWGVARKALNLFLCDCLYNKYLSTRFRLETIESFLEVPLDSIIARELKRSAGRGQLPGWSGLRKLTESQSTQFQGYASQMASQKMIARVHLDVGLWVNNR